MKYLQQTYSRYFNREYKHVGHVFQGKYQRKPIKNEPHYEYIFKYILNNPVEAELVESPEEWPYTEFKNQKIYSDKGL